MDNFPLPWHIKIPKEISIPKITKKEIHLINWFLLCGFNQPDHLVQI